MGDINSDGKLEIAYWCVTVHNGVSAPNGTDDDKLWAIVVDEDMNPVFVENLGKWNGNYHTHGGLRPIITDLNGDGKDDLILREEHGNAYPGTGKIYVISNTGTLISSVDTGISETDGPKGALSADVDKVHSGKEIVYSGPNEIVIVYDSNLVEIRRSNPGTGHVFALNDFNGDGNIDLIVFQTSTSKIRVLNSDFTEIASISISGSFLWRDEDHGAVADLDGDGNNEIIYCTQDGLFVIGRE